jgi:hypothetical protein
MRILRILGYFLMALGVILLLSGVMIRIQHYPDFLKTSISGPISLFLGVIAFAMTIRKV